MKIINNDYRILLNKVKYRGMRLRICVDAGTFRCTKMWKLECPKIILTDDPEDCGPSSISFCAWILSIRDHYTQNEFKRFFDEYSSGVVKC